MEERRITLVSRFGRPALTVASLLSLAASPGFPGAAEWYNPAWTGELIGTINPVFARPTGAAAWLEDQYTPWWQNRVANPVRDYSATLLPTGAARLDLAADVEYTLHRAKQSWVRQDSPTKLNNVYTFTPGSSMQEDLSGRSGQFGYANFGFRPIETVSADIGAEFLGNYDKRYWHPVSDENRMYIDDDHAKIVRTDVQYDDGKFLLRGFQGVPTASWASQNDLFYLRPAELTPEFLRRMTGRLISRGGQMRLRTERFGSLDVMGGAELRLDHKDAVYAKYDLPVLGNLEQAILYRSENIVLDKTTNADPNRRRHSASYNASYLFSDRLAGHWGLLYQPYRVNESYLDADQPNGRGSFREKRLTREEAFGTTVRAEWKPEIAVDQAGAGYSYLGRAAGNRHQVDLDARRTVATDWTLSGAYIFRQPLEKATPFAYEGTPENPGALLSSGRGPDEPFRDLWDNRKAHLLSMTLVFDPTPGTWLYRHQPNILEDWNLNPDEDATWTAALQYRMSHYPTNMDRAVYMDENRNLFVDPAYHTTARATAHPFSAGTGLLQWKKGDWRVVGDLSAGEALAGIGLAYTSATNYYKPSTVFFQSGLTGQWRTWKAFGRLARNVWGPNDYHTEQGLGFKRVYQAGLSKQFLNQFESGFRYVGTRQGEDFLGADAGAFNEYRFYLTWHFGLQRNVARHLPDLGKAVPASLPAASVSLSETEFTPDGSSGIRTVTLRPRAASDAGVASWRLFVRNAKGETVRTWEGQGPPDKPVTWDGTDNAGRALASGPYRVTLEAADSYGNTATSPAMSVEIKSGLQTKTEEALPASGKGLAMRTTAEGLRVSLNSMVLFDTGASQLKPTAKNELDEVIRLLQAYPTNVLRISGHTDAVGQEAYNQALSEKRARAVADYLQAAGVSPNRLRVVGWGKRRPVASNATPDGRQQNRRVDIDILK